MKTVIVIAALLTTAAVSSAASAESLPWGIRTFHDDARSVTCWIYSGIQGGISCLPDSSLQEHTATTTDKNEAARAFQAGSMPENEKLPTTPRIPTEVFQL